MSNLPTAYARKAVEAACLYLRVPVDVVFSPSRTYEATNARFAAILALHHQKRWTKCSIGRRFKRDHTSVLNAIKKAEIRRGECHVFEAAYQAAMRALQ